MPREIIQFQCTECKNRNYSKTKNKTDDHRAARTQEILPVLPQTPAASRDEVDGGRTRVQSIPEFMRSPPRF